MVSAVSCGIEKEQSNSFMKLTFTSLTDGFVLPGFSSRDWRVHDLWHSGAIVR